MALIVWMIFQEKVMANGAGRGNRILDYDKELIHASQLTGCTRKVEAGGKSGLRGSQPTPEAREKTVATPMDRAGLFLIEGGRSSP
jgi:hypothetical protein